MPLSAGSLSASHSAIQCLTVVHLRVHRLDDGQEGHVEAQHPVFGVVGDPGDLVGVQARVEGVQHAARPLTPKYSSRWR